MLALPLYFASHWELAIAAVLAVAVLGVLAFALKNWKLAVAAVVVAIAGFLYQGAVTSGIKDQMAKDAIEQIEILQGRITALSTVAMTHALQVKADEETINKLEDEADDTPKNDGACLDRASAGRVRAIGTGSSKPVTAGTGGYSKLFSKGISKNP